MAHPDFMPGLGSKDPPQYGNPEHSNPEHRIVEHPNKHRRLKNPKRKGRKPRVV